MKKYIICIIIAVVLILSVCIVIEVVKEPELPVLSEELQKELEDAWFEKDGHALGKWGPELRYYGSYDGVSVLFMGGELFTHTTKRIAFSSFWYQHSFLLWAYVDGTFMPLEDAYAAKKIGAIDVATIAKIHRAYHDVYFGHLPYGD